KNAFSGSRRGKRLSALQVAQRQESSGNSTSGLPRTGVPNQTVKGSRCLGLLARDARRRTRLARLCCGVLGRHGSGTKERQPNDRAERASHLARREREHAFGLVESRKKWNRVLANNIEEQRATVFPRGWTHSITRLERFEHSPVGGNGRANPLSGREGM